MYATFLKSWRFPALIAQAAILLPLSLHQAGAQSLTPADEAGAEARRTDWNDNFRPTNVEALVEAGLLALTRDQYQEAGEAFSQALQVSRAVHGLQNEGQLSVLDHLLGAILLSERWQEFDRQLDYLAWLNSRIYQDDPEQLAAGLIRQSDWHRAAAAVKRDQQSAWYLIQAKYLNWQAVSVLENAYGKQDLRLVPVLYRIAMDHYYQAASIERRGMTSYDFKTEGKMVANGWSLSRSETVRRSYRIGRDNLQRIGRVYASDATITPVSRALVTVQRADWEHIFGNSNAAWELYQDAYYELLGAGLSIPMVDAYFSAVTILPLTSLQDQWLGAANKDNEAAVLFQAWSPVYPGAPTPDDVELPGVSTAQPGARASALVSLKLDSASERIAAGSDFGYGVTGIEILNLVPRNEELIARLFEEVPRLKFRPRLQGGELVNHDPISLNYVFNIE